MSATLDHVVTGLLAATRRGILAITADEGEPEALPFALNGVAVTAVAVDARGTALAAGTGDRGVWWTADGQIWKPATALGEGAIVALIGDGAAIYAAAAAGGLHQSRDGGRSFRVLLEPGGDPIAALIAVGPRLVVAGASGGVRVSEDGGKSFRDAGTLPAPVLCLHAPSGGGETVLAGCGDGLYRCARPGNAPWQPIWRDPTRPAVTAVGSGPGSRLVTGAARGLDPARPGEPAGADAALFHGADGGPWSAAGAAGLPVARGRVTTLLPAPRDPSWIFAGTSAGEVFESRDGGASFRLAAATLPGILDLKAGPGLR